ncbi:MAG: cupin domain-containing protein, partial [Bacteroidota bacterium]
PPQGISSAVQHRSVDEIWYVLQGSGEIWREHNRVSSITKISSGVSITIPVHTKFQFRNTGNDSLKIMLVTMPSWPGKDEAAPVDNYWHIDKSEALDQD